MFIWETQEIAHVEVCCATQNIAFGRDLFHALREELALGETSPAAVRKKMAWWETRFRFVDRLIGGQ